MRCQLCYERMRGHLDLARKSQSEARTNLQMETIPPLELDIRPVLDAQQAPLPAILDAVSRLEPGQALLLLVPFEPAPLYDLLASQGFSHESNVRPDGLWEIRFEPQP